jgi:cytochrome c-550 PedF
MMNPDPRILRPLARPSRLRKAVLAAVLSVAASGAAWAHGDVTPQAVDTSSLPKLGDQWRAENPFRGNSGATQIGTSAYNQNCARCHGIDAISGGIAPDLRKLDDECATLKDGPKRLACVAEIDDYFATTVRRGRTRNGAVYMPPFEGTMNQEAVWAIKAYLETRREKPLQAAQK